MEYQLISYFKANRWMSRNGASELALWVVRMNEREREDAQRGSPLIDDEPTTAPARSSESDRSSIAVGFQSFVKSHTIPLALHPGAWFVL
jgi:hypothetical protein